MIPIVSCLYSSNLKSLIVNLLCGEIIGMLQPSTYTWEFYLITWPETAVYISPKCRLFIARAAFTGCTFRTILKLKCFRTVKVILLINVYPNKVIYLVIWWFVSDSNWVLIFLLTGWWTGEVWASSLQFCAHTDVLQPAGKRFSHCRLTTCMGCSFRHIQ